jgi:transcription elongation factor GreA
VCEIVRLADKRSKNQIERLLRAFEDTHSDKPSLAAVLDHYNLVESPKPVDDLRAMELWLEHEIGTAVEVIGQGVGRVANLNLELGNLKVDIGASRPVSVPFGAVSRYVRVLPEGDFLRDKVEDPQGLEERIKNDPPGTLVHILESTGEPTDVATIKSCLDGLLPMSSWSSWWTKARKSPRILTSGSGSRLRYSVTESAADATDALLAELESASPRDRLKTAKNLGARGVEAAQRAADFLRGGLADLEDRDPGLAWETADLLRALTKESEDADEVQARLASDVLPLKLLSGIREKNARQQALQLIRSHRRDAWMEIWAEWMLHEKSAPLLDVLAHELDVSGGEESLDSTLEIIFRKHLEHTAQFIWAAEAMTNESSPAAVQRRLRPSLLEKIPDTLTRKDFAEFRSRAKGLLEGGKAAIRLILEQATPQQAERFAQRMARIDAVDPGQLHLVEQAAIQCKSKVQTETVTDTMIFAATQDAVDAKRAELKELVEVEIPKTLKGINAAAAEGDLRENFEYHMLRDRQELQSARAAKLQEDLARVRILEPNAAETSKVNIGTIVSLEGVDGSPIETLTILGAWDADINRRIFANGTELAQKLLGHEVGDQVEVEGQAAVITGIAAWPKA